MSDFVQNLVRRAAGMAGPVTIRPPLQPYFEPSLPLTQGSTLPEHVPASLQAARRAPTQMESPVTTQPAPPRLAPKAAEPSPRQAMPVETVQPMDLSAQRRVDAGSILESPTASSPGASTLPSSSSTPESERAPMQRVDRRAADAVQRSASSAPMAQPRPTGWVQAAVDESIKSSPAYEIETVQAGEVSQAQPRPEQPQGSLIGVQSLPDQPPVARPSPDSATVHLPTVAVEPVVQPEVVSAWAKSETRQAISAKPEASLPVEPHVLDTPGPVGPTALPSPRRPVTTRSGEQAPQLVRPAPAPPPPDVPLAVAPSQAAALPEAAPSVEVRIGTVEVRASRPAPSHPPRPAPRPQGFDDYAYLRG